jgi:hypothetical protein
VVVGLASCVRAARAPEGDGFGWLLRFRSGVSGWWTWRRLAASAIVRCWSVVSTMRATRWPTWEALMVLESSCSFPYLGVVPWKVVTIRTKSLPDVAGAGDVDALERQIPLLEASLRMVLLHHCWIQVKIFGLVSETGRRCLGSLWSMSTGGCSVVIGLR